MEKFLGNLEEKIMNILWERNTPTKPSEVLEILGKDYAYTTIMTVMSRLYEKGILKRDSKSKAYYYFPSKSKEKFLAPKLKNFFNNIISSYGDLAISQFIDSIKDLNPDELNRIKKDLNNE